MALTLPSPVALLLGAAAATLLSRLLLGRRNPYNPGADSHVVEAVSASMLHGEVEPDKRTHCHIVGLFVFEEALRYEDLRRTFVANMVLSDPDSRLLYRLDCSGSTPRWVKAACWRPEDNCRLVREPHDHDSVHALVSRRLVDAMPTSRPLWEMAFIERFELGGGRAAGSCVMLTLHHSMGDGFTLCHQLLRRGTKCFIIQQHL